MPTLRVATGCIVVVILIASQMLVAPAQVTGPRQQWSVSGLRVATPRLDVHAVAPQRMRIKLVSIRDETFEIDATSFSVEPTATGLAVRAGGTTTVSAPAPRGPLKDATFEMTMTPEGVVHLWASGHAGR